MLTEFGLLLHQALYHEPESIILGKAMIIPDRLRWAEFRNLLG